MVSLLLSEIVRAYVIQLDYGRVQEKLQRFAASHEDPDRVIQTYRENPEMMKNVEDLVMEDQVVEFLMERMDVKEIPKSFFDVVSPAGSAPEA